MNRVKIQQSYLDVIVVLILFGCGACTGLPSTGTPVSRPISALDCRKPTAVTTSTLTNICQTNYTTNEVETEDVLILQYSTKRTVKGIRCTKKISRMSLVCGALSHSKILGPLDILIPTVFGASECQDTVDRRSYEREDGTLIPIRIDQKIYYKYIEHGSLTLSENNVECSGSSVQINGETHGSVVTLVSVEISLETVNLEVDTDSIVDLDQHIKLNPDCARSKVCLDGYTSYIIEHEGVVNCPFYSIRQLQMKTTMVTTPTGRKEALVNTHHKLFFILEKEEVTESGCKSLYLFKVTPTAFPDIKILRGHQAFASISSLLNQMSPSILNIDLELRCTAEYLTFLFEEKLRNQMKNVGQNLCDMSKHSLSTAETSPFHANSLIRIRGELVSELTCTAVDASIRIGETRGSKCTANSIPGWLYNSPIYIEANTRLILEPKDVYFTSCTNRYPPVFVLQDGTMVTSTPTIETVHIELAHLTENYLHFLEPSTLVHEDLGTNLLYTTEEMDSFNELIHFQRTKEKILSNLVNQYCQDNSECGSSVTTGGNQVFSLDSLKAGFGLSIPWLNNIRDELKEAGSYCSILIILYVLFKILLKVLRVCTLKLGKKKLPLKQAIQLSFNITGTMREAMLTEHTVEPSPTPVQQVQRSENRTEYIPMRPILEEIEYPTSLVPYTQYH